MRRFDALTFDCYGTLIDWERGITDAFDAAARADGVWLDHEATLAAYHEIEPRLQAERYRPYRDVLALTARAVADRLGWTLAPGGEAFLPDSVPSWPPFPDTTAAGSSATPSRADAAAKASRMPRSQSMRVP